MLVAQLTPAPPRGTSRCQRPRESAPSCNATVYANYVHPSTLITYILVRAHTPQGFGRNGCRAGLKAVTGGLAALSKPRGHALFHRLHRSGWLRRGDSAA